MWSMGPSRLNQIRTNLTTAKNGCKPCPASYSLQPELLRMLVACYSPTHMGTHTHTHSEVATGRSEVSYNNGRKHKHTKCVQFYIV